MQLKKIITFFVLSLSTFSFAQREDNLYGFSLGYANQSGHFGKIGAFYIFDSSSSIATKIDINANMAYMRDDFQIIPEIGITGYITSFTLLDIFPFVETEFTPYTFTPKAGFSIFTMIDFGFGYGIKLHEKDNFKPIKGFQFSVGINIPLNLHLKMM